MFKKDTQIYIENQLTLFKTLQNKPLDEIFQVLKTSDIGLNDNEIKQRQELYGLNILTGKKKVSKVQKFVISLVEILSLLLFFASILAWIAKEYLLAITIVIVIFINSGFMVYQEWRTEQEMKALKSWIPEYAKVIRKNDLKKILVSEVVPGDIILLEEGDRVPADARLIDAHDLYAIEIPLTGEFNPQLKSVEITENIRLSRFEENLIEQNIVFMSTSIARGNAKAIVISTGMATRFGQVAHLAQEVKQPPSPLQQEIKHFAKYSFFLAFLVGGLFYFIGYFFLNLNPFNAALFVIGVMIACVPEGLQATISSSLAISVSKLTKKNVIVKKLSAVETLGGVTLICTDKTGTLTKGEMTVSKLWTYDKVIDISGVGYAPKGEFKVGGKRIYRKEHEDVRRILYISAMCNTAKLDPPNKSKKTWTIIGDPTDGAMLVAAIKFGLNIKEILSAQPILHIFTFDSDRKMMTTVHDLHGWIRAYAKGAPGKILDKCNKIEIMGKQINLTESLRTLIRTRLNDFATTGLRVIGIASRDLSSFSNNKDTETNRDLIEKELTFLGLAAMKDPPRIEVRDAMQKARNAGIKIVMITGDYGITAKVIAKEVGLITNDKEAIVIKGDNLNKMADIQIVQALKSSGTIFSRVTPDQKLRIINIGRQTGEIVAVTGDGANDAPALHQADIGIAMGITGTDIAKESSDIILTDDNFASIVNAIEEGRRIWTNLRKFIYFVYTHNWAELVPFILFVALATPLPLLAVHVLLIDLCIDIIPSLALSRDPPEPGIMDKPPRSLKEHLFKTSVFLRSLLIGTIVGSIGFVLCIHTWAIGGWQWGEPLAATDPVYLKGITMMYSAIVIGQFANLLTCRKTNTSVFQVNVQKNSWIYYGILWQFGVLCVTIYVPFFQPIFSTHPLLLSDWLLLMIIPLIIVPIQEIWRIVENKRKKLENGFIKKV